MKRHTGHLFKRGKAFYCSWRVNRQVFSKVLRDEHGNPIVTKRDAEVARTKLMASFASGDETSALESISAKLEGRKGELARIEDQLNPPLSITRTWDAFLEMHNRPDSGDSTLHQYQIQFDQFEAWMKEHHSDKPALRDVTKEIAAEYATHLFKRGVSPNTFNKHLNLLTLVFRVLADKAKLTTNPWQNIQRKHMIPQSRRELTIDELKQVCESASGEMRLLLAFGIFGGLRLGDCATMRWAEVDLQRLLIRRIPMKMARRNQKPVLIPIHQTLRMLLEEVPPDKRSEYVLPQTAERYQRNASAVTYRIKTHFESCGMSVHKPGTGQGSDKRAVVEVGHHSLRHTFVSLCRGANVPLSVVEAIVGHSNPAMTQHYTHTGEAAAIAAVNTLPNILDRIGTQPKLALPSANLTATVGHSETTIDGLAQFEAVFRTGLETMTPENWNIKRNELLGLLPSSKASAKAS